MASDTILFKIKANDFFSPVLNKIGRQFNVIQNRKLAPINQKVQQIRSSMEKLNSVRLNKFANAASAVFATKGVLSFTKDAEVFQDKFASVQKVLNGGQEAVDSARKGILELSRTIPLAIPELTELYEAGAKIGLSGQGLDHYAKLVSKISVALDGSTEEIGQTMSKLTTFFAIDLKTDKGRKELESVADTLNYVADNTKANATEMVDVLKRVSAAGKIEKISNEDIVALSAVGAMFSTTSEVGGSAMSKIIKKLAKFDFEKKGGAFDYKEIAREGVKDGTVTIDGMIDVFKSMNTFKRGCAKERNRKSNRK